MKIYLVNHVEILGAVNKKIDKLQPYNTQKLILDGS